MEGRMDGRTQRHISNKRGTATENETKEIAPNVFQWDRSLRECGGHAFLALDETGGVALMFYCLTICSVLVVTLL